MFKSALNDNWTWTRLPGRSIEEFGEHWVDGSFTEQKEAVCLPHTWYTEENPYRGPVLYERQVQVSEKSEHLFVDIPAAEQQAKVYVDDVLTASHRGGYSAFRAEVPKESLERGSFVLRILVSNEANQEISPLAGDFAVYGGLYRGVNLIQTKAAHFDYLYYGTDGVIARTELTEADGMRTGHVFCEPHVVAPQGAQIRYVIRTEDGTPVVSGTFPADQSAVLSVENPALWNGRGEAHLYLLEADLLVNGTVTDSVTKKIGFRSIHLDAGRGFFLNGKHVRLNGVAKHQDTEGKWNAVSDPDIDRDFDLIDEIGANAVRLSHYQHPQHAYDVADERGYLVWAEIPMLKMPDRKEVFENAELQLKELILQNLHHPSIFCWGIQNEIGMYRDEPYMYGELRRMKEIAKRLDPSRPVACANLYTVKAASGLNSITDLVGYNVYFGWYYGKMQDYDAFLDRLHAARPELPLGMSEYGVDANPCLHSETPMVRDYSEEYQALYHESVYPIFKSKSYLWGTFVWNMFDFASPMRREGGVLNRNLKGLVSFDRTVRKDSFYYYKAQWSKEPFVHICSGRFFRRCSKEIDVKIYTNEETVTLYRNGRQYATEKNTGSGVVLFEHVPLQDGANSLEAVGNGPVCPKDSCSIIRTKEPDASYQLKDGGAGSMVRNWFLQDNDIVREGYFSIENTANEILQNPEAKRVLMKYAPQLVRTMTERDVIPLGLSLRSILSRGGDEIDQAALNKALNQVPADDL